MRDCPVCEGNGEIECKHGEDHFADCTHCHGQGVVVCHYCEGSGVLEVNS